MAIQNTTTKPKVGRKSPVQLERIARGNCRWCDMPRGVDGTRDLCRTHADMVVAAAKRKRVRDRAAGLCDKCCKPLTPHHRKTKRLCKNCVSPRPIKGMRFCRYGITDDDYLRMVASQGGVCVICKQPETGGRTKRLSVDHCHASKKVRGLLCGSCNRGLGSFRDDPSRLRAAAAYIENTAAKLF